MSGAIEGKFIIINSRTAYFSSSHFGSYLKTRWFSRLLIIKIFNHCFIRYKPPVLQYYIGIRAPLRFYSLDVPYFFLSAPGWSRVSVRSNNPPHVSRCEAPPRSMCPLTPPSPSPLCSKGRKGRSRTLIRFLVIRS